MVEVKNCCVCKAQLVLSAFGKNKNKKDGLQPQCKGCNKDRYHVYYEANKNKIADRNKIRYEVNKDKLTDYHGYSFVTPKEKTVVVYE